ncbi:lipid-A-disaccharide synthase N-terminal domain-containing protein [candidate division KSB1 bacterium]|nr:lipid-A-disaccharide synthase N-terminal domain-containing protein [candidate division KSB1 bacterium]
MNMWLILGFTAQGLFGMRLIIQWIASEREKKSVVPVYFWHCSLFGGILLLVYAIHRKDPVFILGQLSGTFIYIRNLILIYRQRQEASHASVLATSIEPAAHT